MYIKQNAHFQPMDTISIAYCHFIYKQRMIKIKSTYLWKRQLTKFSSLSMTFFENLLPNNLTKKIKILFQKIEV